MPSCRRSPTWLWKTCAGTAAGTSCRSVAWCTKRRPNGPKSWFGDVSLWDKPHFVLVESRGSPELRHPQSLADLAQAVQVLSVQRDPFPAPFCLFLPFQFAWQRDALEALQRRRAAAHGNHFVHLVQELLS